MSRDLFRQAAKERRTLFNAWLMLNSPFVVELVGAEQADHFREDWRAMSVVCARGDMLQVYSRGRKPGRARS